MSNFTQAQIQQLFEQHTTETGQLFEEGTVDLAWHYTEGQPWLENAMAYEITYNMPAYKARSVLITVKAMEEAKERLILRRDTHLDQLVDKLQEERVRNVIEPLLAGEGNIEALNINDLQYVIDLGLITKGIGKTAYVSNAIYREIIPRELTYTTQYTIQQQQSWYIKQDGSLDIPKLLRAFQDFFRKHSEHWVERFEYKEAGPQLLLQAFLQRIVNGGGRIEREYGFGRRRTDLFVEFFYGEDQKQEVVIELKILYDSLENTIKEGLKQTKQYMDKCGTNNGHLLIFDRRKEVAWEEKIWEKEMEGIYIWGS